MSKINKKIIQSTADKLTEINKIMRSFSSEEIGYLKSAIKKVQKQISVVDNVGSMFDPSAARAKVKNLKQGIDRMNMVINWRKKMRESMEAGIEYVKAKRDRENMEKVMGL